MSDVTPQPAEPPAATPTHSVCVATYRRPELLRDLLDSLVIQEPDDGSGLEIIVVDNDRDTSAEAIVAPYAERVSGGVHYRSQPEQNISLTRNVAVAAARGRLLYFIDDDEVATPGWLEALMTCLDRYEADGVFGRVTPRFDDDAPTWARSSFLFNRHCGQTGSPTRRPRTSNALVRAGVVSTVDGPFDPRYGRTGGEDTHLFARLAAEGARFVDCFEAEVIEFQPPERTTWTWLRQRALRTGSLQTRREVDLAGGSSAAAVRSAARGAAYAGVCLVMGLATVTRPATSRNWRLRSLYGVGQVRGAFGRVSDGY